MFTILFTMIGMIVFLVNLVLGRFKRSFKWLIGMIITGLFVDAVLIGTIIIAGLFAG